jgi:hypothetical protein
VEPIVLIVGEGALLSVVCARLAMAGETPITARDWHDPRLGPELRGKATLVVEGAFLSQDGEAAVRSLREMGWCGKLVILADNLPDGGDQADICWVPRRNGTAGVLAALAKLRTAA